MEVYLTDRETKEIKQTFRNVTNWAENYVEYYNGGRAKTYCDTEAEYFTDISPEEVVNESRN